MGSMLSHTSFEWAIVAGIAGAMVYGYITHSKSDPGAPATTPIGGKVAKGKKKKKKIQTPKTGISELSEKLVSTTTSTTTVATTPTTQGNPVPEPEPIVVPFPHVIMPGEFGAVVPTLDDQGAHATQNKGKKKKQKKQEKGAPHDIDNASEQLASYSGGDAAAPGSSGTTTIDIDMSSESLKEEEDLRIRSSSPSFDTDSSWTRIDHQRTARPRGTKVKAAATGLDDRGLAITTDVTAGSDAGPSTGDSSIADQMDEDANASQLDAATRDNQNNRRTLAEKLLPKPRKTAVDDMLERPDYPGLARVMRVHPRANEAPAPGFSWKDYEDVDVDDGSGTLNDGENGVGEWGIVKGKSRSTSKDATTSLSQVVQKAPEQLTQKQRQNARRNQLAKTAKADAEAERLAKLAERKRVMERERIIEQSRRGASRATVDSRGKLVYD